MHMISRHTYHELRSLHWSEDHERRLDVEVNESLIVINVSVLSYDFNVVIRHRNTFQTAEQQSRDQREAVRYFLIIINYV